MNVKRVTFNVCGTRYETNRSVLEDKPDTMLAMLLRNQSPEEKEIFVQSDPRMFRWILYYYTSGILVEYDTVGVPKEVWDRELEYYSLFSAEEKKEEDTRKRVPPVDESHELASLAKKHLTAITTNDDAKKEKRHAIYKILLEFMMSRMRHTKDIRTGFDFVGKGPSQKPIDWPYDYPQQLRDINFKDIDAHFDEFEEYAKPIGFALQRILYRPSHMGKAKHPISKGYVKTQHQLMSISIEMLQE
jgi:hypothetical protein